MVDLQGCFAFLGGQNRGPAELEQLILQHLHLLTLTVQAVPEFWTEVVSSRI